MAWFIITILISVVIQPVISERPTRWCVTSEDEEVKCNELKRQLRIKKDALLIGETLPFPEDFQCIRTFDAFNCMDMIENDKADLISLDSGQSYFAGRQHNMMPIMAENYVNKDSAGKPMYYSVALFKATQVVSLNTLYNTRVCFPGIGTSAGWVYPVGILLEKNLITVTECNAIVKAVSNSFQSMCLPGAVNSFYNPFGNNPTSVCSLCRGHNNEFCTTSDYHAGFDGAYRCLVDNYGDLAFIRHDTIEQMAGSVNGSGTENFRLLCPDGNTMRVDQFERCHWGAISSDTIMTSAVRDPATKESYRELLRYIGQTFGSSSSEQFKIFESKSSYESDIFKRTLLRKNQMFSDMTIGFYDIGESSYFEWAGVKFQEYLQQMNGCPSEAIRWCVISMAEKLKCEDMMMAFKAKSLQPEMDCLYGGNTSMCLEMIWRGDADLINLDAGDIYIAGVRYGLIPIAAEDYGDMSMQFKVVAVARKTDKSTTLFNMKGMRACQPGIGRGDGWIVPLNIYIETEQFLPEDCSIFRNIGELFVRSCIPGALDTEYNPKGVPINLCEGCAAGGFRKCKRNSEEPYYGASGAFRCLVENGGDVSFVRHLTVRDNTDGRNHAIWARNRRSDDYELMCKDGRRLNIDRFEECHLGYVPSNAIVTSPRKNAVQKEIMWNLLNYGQQFFSSDIDGDFHMFDSGLWYTDLIFTDATVRLMKIPEDRQNYKAWLGESFIAQIENLQKYTCVNPNSGMVLSPSRVLISCVAMVFSLLLNL